MSSTVHPEPGSAGIKRHRTGVASTYELLSACLVNPKDMDPLEGL